MPKVSTQTMQVFLDECAKTIAPDEHVMMVLDQAPSGERQHLAGIEDAVGVERAFD